MGKGAPAPDYTPLANASKHSAQVMARLGQRQLRFARQQYRDMKPELMRIAELQAAAQQEQLQQARDYYRYQRETFRPLEQSIVADAQNFNTEAYRNQMASQAAASVGLAYQNTEAARARSMASMGVNPNSGRFASLARADALGLAAQRAGAMTGARTQAEAMGHARAMEAAGLGRGLSGQSLAAYSGAVGAGTAAGHNWQSAGQNYMGNMAIGSGTIAGGQQMHLQGLANVLNAQTNAYVNSNDSFLGDVGGILGGAAGLATAIPPLVGLSDRRVKTDITKVGSDNRTGLNLYRFAYKAEPSVYYVGVMADEVEAARPDAVHTVGGYKAVDYGALGLKLERVL